MNCRNSYVTNMDTYPIWRLEINSILAPSPPPLPRFSHACRNSNHELWLHSYIANINILSDYFSLDCVFFYSRGSTTTTTTASETRASTCSPNFQLHHVHSTEIGPVVTVHLYAHKHRYTTPLLTSARASGNLPLEPYTCTCMYMRRHAWLMWESYASYFHLLCFLWCLLWRSFCSPPSNEESSTVNPVVKCIS